MTGHTNNFHIQSGSQFAMLYNDRSVLENHHVSACYRLMKEDDKNIFERLTRDEFRYCCLTGSPTSHSSSLTCLG